MKMNLKDWLKFYFLLFMEGMALGIVIYGYQNDIIGSIKIVLLKFG